MKILSTQLAFIALLLVSRVPAADSEYASPVADAHWAAPEQHLETESISATSMPRQRMCVAVIADGPARRENFAEMIRVELLEVASKSLDIVFADAYTERGGWRYEDIAATVDAALKDDAVDMVIAAGHIASFYLCRLGPLPKPGIAARIIDPEVLGVASANGRSGVRNMTYIAIPNPLRRDIAVFHEMIAFRSLAILADSQLKEVFDELQRKVLENVQDMGLEPVIVGVDDDIQGVIDVLARDIDVVYFGPLDRLTDEELNVLIAETVRLGLPSFSLMGARDVRAGVLASLRPDTDYRRMARRVALYAQRISQGTRPEELGTELGVGERLTLNMATARSVGYYPPWEMLHRASLIDEELTDVDRHYNLRAAVLAALDSNLELSERERRVRASAQNIPAAVANLLPQVDGETSYVVIDERIATPMQPERLWTASVKVRQLIYDEMAHANVIVQKRLHKALEHEYDGFELDIAKLAAEAYFNVLRAKTYEAIQKSNMEKTRENLELARLRKEIGVSGPGEVYRWEAQLAQNRIEVMNAHAQRRAAEIQFNRVLNEEQETLFVVEEVGIHDALLISSETLVLEHLTDPVRFEWFRDFLVNIGLEAAPELRQLEEGVAAHERLYTASRRKYYTPTLGVQAELRHLMHEGGAGTGGFTRLFIPGQPDNAWNVGFRGTLPIYTGGARRAEHIQARESLEGIQLKRRAVEQKLEQRIRMAAHQAGASFSNIAEARGAAEAAGNGMRLVADGYARGLIDITSLLDAQNASLTAELAAAGAIYTFMLDLMELYRAIGVFGFLESESYREAWVDRLEAYLETRMSGTGSGVLNFRAATE